MKKLVRTLEAHYQPKNCVYCDKELNPMVSDKTASNPERQEGIHKDDPQSWHPHYDVEYLCEDCGYNEHYTHDANGAILAMRINKIILYL